MPLGNDILGDGWRKVDIAGVGALEVRRPLMRDLVTQSGNPYWWVECVRCTDGSRLLPDGVSPADIDATVGNAILAEVMKDRPTAGSSAGSGA